MKLMNMEWEAEKSGMIFICIFYIPLSNTLVSPALTAQLKDKFKLKDIFQTHFCVQRKGCICTSM